MDVRSRTFCAMFLVLVLGAAACLAGEEVNLLPNGGFEQDGDGDGVADEWIAQEFNFSRQTREEVQAYIKALPSYEELLAGDRILAADGTALYDRDPGGSWRPRVPGTQGHWGDYERSWKPEENWYATMRKETLWRNSRFGPAPTPEGLDLGRVTLVLSSKRPHGQVASEPIAVKPDTGYRLSFRVRTSGGGEYWRGPQVLDGAHDPESVPVSEKLYGNPHVVNAIPATYWWGSGVAGRYWAGMELPFRTGPGCESIVIRLPYNHREEAARRKMGNENYRIWYDDLRLVEDPSVRGAGPVQVGYAERSEPEWPAEAVELGFVAAPRPTLPMTYGSYVPTREETRAPIRLALCAGESDSAVIFVRALGDAVTVRAAPGGRTLVSEAGYGLANNYGARFVAVRATEMANRFLTAKRYVQTPKFLLNSTELALRERGSGQFWMTVSVPHGTPPGIYAGEVKITRVKPAGGEESERQVSVPVALTVRDMELEEADAAFFTWYHTAPVPRGSPMGPAHALPGADEIYLADQRRHGMNTLAVHCYAERKDKDGAFHLTFNELDAMVANVRRAGLCRTHPLLLHTWRDGEKGGEFCEFAGGKATVMAISRHAREAGWPEPLFGVLDEPCSQERSARVTEIINDQYAEPRKEGVRTAVAGGYPGAFTRPLNEKGDTIGDLYDVWIEGHYGDRWPETHRAAKDRGAELWMYNCWLTGAGYLQERFYAGLWTWRTGVKGNGVWSYGWYVRINDSGLPESKIAWEGRAAGVNDYRYLQTLEHTIAAGDASGRAGAGVRNAKAFLDALRGRIPLAAYRQRPGALPQNQWAELDVWNPVPEILPEDYAHIRDDCARHISAVRGECGL